MNRNDLPEVLYTSLQALGGEASIIEVSKYIWTTYQQELEKSGDFFYSWQYDMRWAALALRKEGKMKAAETGKKGIWKIE